MKVKEVDLVSRVSVSKGSIGKWPYFAIHALCEEAAEAIDSLAWNIAVGDGGLTELKLSTMRLHFLAPHVNGL
jgi:hypothetical protein